MDQLVYGVIEHVARDLDPIPYSLRMPRALPALTDRTSKLNEIFDSLRYCGCHWLVVMVLADKPFPFDKVLLHIFYLLLIPSEYSKSQICIE